ncbi:hypothetical protein Pint_25168 [Pistacia integerrima]|uniref:Uncharacterized protein n=1 Tax=Pistacia integerrima TaxID=434235 RepID=A0ACC0YA91_9ROSI|nr:hypothetical protein Pint_25168 [Pistacia integerrima]
MYACRYPAALHVVHEADDGSVAVVASIFNYGRQDPLIQEVHFPSHLSV